jgi:thymidylate synthase
MVSQLSIKQIHISKVKQLTKADIIYQNNIAEILSDGSWDENPRPRYESDGTPAHSLFITQVFEKYNIGKGELPITTLRPISIKKAISEILWIYQDQSNELSLLRDKHGIYWWDLWDVGDGTIGQRYGATVKKYNLIRNLIKGLKEDKFSRRHMMSLWQESDFKDTKGLPPCAFQTLWSVRKVNGEYYLDCTLTQRSSDYLVAGHINMIQYVALQMMVAHECGYKVGNFARTTQNLHIYQRHIEQAHELLSRTPSKRQAKLILNAEGKSFWNITVDDFELINYYPVKPQLKFELGV